MNDVVVFVTIVIKRCYEKRYKVGRRAQSEKKVLQKALKNNKSALSRKYLITV